MHRVGELTLCEWPSWKKWVYLAVCWADECHTLKDQMLWGEEWSGNGLFPYWFFYMVSLRAHMGQSPFSAAQENQSAWQQRLGWCWKHLTFQWGQWSLGHSFHCKNAVIAQTLPMKIDIKRTTAHKEQGLQGRKNTSLWANHMNTFVLSSQ